MKKNITINLFGTLYNIDEDAYQLLDNYLQSMKRYFGRKDGGEEIANDIEHRVAELLWVKKNQGMEAVNLDVIKEIIGTIGNAEEIAGVDKEENEERDTSGTYTGNEQEDENYESGTASPWQRFRHYFRYRRLYRDPEDKLLGGVCSGLSYYIGFGDPVLWRLLLLLAFLVQGFGLIAYLVMWLIVPEARTPEDRLKMKGIQPTPDNLNKQILQEHTGLEQGNAGGRHSNGSGCLKVLLGLLLLPPLLIVIFLIGIFTSVMGGLMGGAIQFSGSDWNFVNALFNMTRGMAVSGVICILAVLVICMVLLVRWLFGSRRPMRTGTKWTLFAIVVLGILWAIFSISHSVAKVRSWLDANPDVHAWYSVTSSKPKHKPQPHLDVPYLNETGFSVVTNNTIRCTWSGDYPTGDGDKRYLDACNYDYRLMFTVEKQDTVKPGFYDLYAIVRAKGDGAFVYAKSHGIKMLQAIPAVGNEHGDLWKWACGNATIAKMQEVYPGFCPDSVRQQIAAANDSQGFGWSVVSIQNINVGSDGIVAYGISTAPTLTGETPECYWVSATDFVLVPVNGKNKQDVSASTKKEQVTVSTTKMTKSVPATSITQPDVPTTFKPDMQEQEHITAHRRGHEVMSPAEFGMFTVSLKKASSSSEKQTLVKTVANNWGFTCNQCKQILKEITYESDKVEVLKLLYPKVVDKKSFMNVISKLAYSSDREEMYDFIK